MSDREDHAEETAGAAKTLAVVAGVVLLMIAGPAGYFLYQLNELDLEPIPVRGDAKSG